MRAESISPIDKDALYDESPLCEDRDAEVIPFPNAAETMRLRHEQKIAIGLGWASSEDPRPLREYLAEHGF